MRRILFGIALHQDRGDEFVERLKDELTELQAGPPPIPELLPKSSRTRSGGALASTALRRDSVL
jgi:hypothetical protein